MFFCGAVAYLVVKMTFAAQVASGIHLFHANYTMHDLIHEREESNSAKAVASTTTASSIVLCPEQPSNLGKYLHQICFSFKFIFHFDTKILISSSPETSRNLL
jgi:hypothetical protein